MLDSNTFIHCTPLSGLGKYWDLIAEGGQLFYDYRINLFTFRKGSEFMTVNIKDNIPVPDIRFHLDITEQISSISYSKNKKYVAIKTISSAIRVINVETRQELKLSLKSSDKSSSIIMFDWLWKLFSDAEFFVLDSSSLYLFKVDEKKMTMKQVAHHSLDFNFAWFEPKSEVLILATTTGLLQTIFLDVNPKSKKIKGPSFLLDLRMKNKDPKLVEAGTAQSYQKWNTPNFSVQSSLRNQDIFQVQGQEIKLENELHKILFVNMYGVPSLIHINVDYGTIFIFFITPERVNIFQSSLSVSPLNLYSLSLVDNLIVVNNLTSKTSQVFDTKKLDPTKPIGSAQSLLIYETGSQPKQDDISFVDSHINLIKKPELRRIKSAPEDEKEDSQAPSSELNDENQKYEGMHEQAILMEENLDDFAEQKQNENGQRGRPKKTSAHRKLSRVEYKLNSSPPPANEKPNAPMILINPFYNALEDKKESVSCSGPVLSRISILETEDEKDKMLYSYFTRTLDYNYFVDTKNRTILRYELDAKRAPDLIKDDVDSFFFLIRRNNCKDVALEFLKKMFINKTDLASFSFIFHKLLEIYLKAQQEIELYQGTRVSLDQFVLTSFDTREEGETKTSSINPNHSQLLNLKTSNSYNVIVQIDMHNKVFTPLLNDNEFDHEYLIHILLEYVRTLLENDVPVLEKVQIMILKIMFMRKLYPMLLILIQFYSLADNSHLAEALLKLGTKNKSTFNLASSDNPFLKYIDEDEYLPEFIQTGIDILHRLKNHKLIFNYLLQVGKITDALELVKRENFENVDIKWLLDFIYKQHGLNMYKSVRQFLLNNIKKSKAEKSLFEPSIQDLISSFEKEFQIKLKK